MIHVRLTVPRALVDDVAAVLIDDPCVVHVVRHRDAAFDPDGDAFSADVPKEHASVLVHQLRELDLHLQGGIILEDGGVAADQASEEAERRARGSSADGVVWEDVEARSGEAAELSRSFLWFMGLGTVLATVALILDSPVLMVGAMVVGPEFGPIAAASVALADLRGGLAWRSARALAVGLPFAVVVAFAFAWIGKVVGIGPDELSNVSQSLAVTIARPDAYSVVVAVAAGAAGLLSMTTAKSGALVGVLVSVTTLPAAANIGLAVAYGDADGALGSLAQLVLNVALMFAAGVLTLVLQRRGYEHRLRQEARRER
ncbi:DUF389 domain-containing protein [Patulibacter sp.]|uniref:DUF389 domain-containing protein n=1 Tax=Patulibacter sp. TaxID=1912859 RepID=UPI0027201FD6|nr:DUF389 domain-containing protein [Patulibacter sp.]MDO9410545.1 DUF389 domain-containing protein [Patulibacter sp.]